MRVTGAWGWRNLEDALHPVDRLLVETPASPPMRLVVRVNGQMWYPYESWTRILAEAPGEILWMTHAEPFSHPVGQDPRSLASRGASFARVDLRP